MTALNASQKAILDSHLEQQYVSHLRPLLRPEAHQEKNQKKNIARSLSAFFIESTLGLTARESAKCVYDDFDDVGIDAAYHQANEEKSTLYLIQSKHLINEAIVLEDILKFRQGVINLIHQDYTGFNANFQQDILKFQSAVEEATEIILVLAHSGHGVNVQASRAMRELLSVAIEDDSRVSAEYIDFGPTEILQELRRIQAPSKINAVIEFDKFVHISNPRRTYIGIIPLVDLIALHNNNGKYLYERNIRTFLGHKTNVNDSIAKTLADESENFLFLNNGIAALCEEITPKGRRANGSNIPKLKIRGISVINGAQTIAASAKFAKDNPGADISCARVTLTLIQAPTDGEFGKDVTRARNHQNAVRNTNFTALDDRQELIRKDLAFLGYNYIYKAGISSAAISDLQPIHLSDVASSLSLFQRDPRYTIWAKRDALILDPSTTQYQAIFNDALTAHQIVNAHHLWAFGSTVLNDAASAASGQERLVYRHGRNAILWIAAMRYLRSWERLTRILSSQDIGSIFSGIIDDIRQDVFDEYQRTHGYKGPLAYFGNMTDTLGLLEKVMIRRFNLVADPAIAPQQAIANPAEGYNMRLFDYMINQAPVIGVPA